MSISLLFINKLTLILFQLDYSLSQMEMYVNVEIHSISSH